MSGRGALFLDRDGTIHRDTGYLHRIEAVVFRPGIFALCRAARARGLALVVVTNQSGIGRGLFSQDDFHRLSGWMSAVFSQENAPLDRIEYCPEAPAIHAGGRRKPAPGMLLDAAHALGLDPARSVMLGDRGTDMEAAWRAGVARRVLAPEGDLPAEEGRHATHRLPPGADLRLARPLLPGA